MSYEFDSGEGEEKTIWIQQFEESLRQGSSFYIDFNAFEKMLEYYQGRGKFQLALKVCEMAQEQMPFDVEVLVAKASLLNQLNRQEEALELLDGKILCMHPNDSNALLEKASALIEIGKTEEALNILPKALDGADDRSEVHYRVGIAYLQVEKTELAIRELKKSLQHNPVNDIALMELSICLEETDRDGEGLEFYKRYVDEKPYSANIWYNMGFAYNKLEQHEKAIQAYEYAYLIDEQFSSALFNKGKTHLELEQMQEAIDCFRGVLKIEGPCPDSYTQIGAAYSQVKGHEKQALHFYQTALQENPKHSEAWFGMGCHYLRENKTEKAIKLIQKAIELKKDDANYWKGLGQAYYLSAKFQKSIEAYEEAVVLEPREQSTWLEWSHVYFEQKKFNSAIDIMQEALDEFPMSARCLFKLAAYMLLSEKTDEGLSLFRQAIHLDFELHHEVLVHYPSLQANEGVQALIEEFK